MTKNKSNKIRWNNKIDRCNKLIGASINNIKIKS